MKNGWILFVAGRYLRVKRKTSGIGSALLAVGGLAVGVMALLTVLSVMNGFQLNFIEDILEISSFHIRITDLPGTTGGEDPDGDLIRSAASVPGIKSVLPFRDIQTLSRGRDGEFTPCLVRALPPDTAELDPDLIRQLNVYQGSFDLSTENTIILGFELAYRLGVYPGDQVSLVSMAGETFSLLSPETRDFRVAGIFRSGYYEFDSGLALISLKGAGLLADETGYVYGIKLRDRYRDQAVLGALQGASWLGDRKITSWREYNRAFFGALRMEKNAMIILVGLIFLVVGVNIYHSQKRAVMERQEEIGILRTLGASPSRTRQVFLLEGVLIGLLGATLGVLLGLLLTQNLQEVFAAAERIGNWGVALGNGVLRLLGQTDRLLRPVSRAFFYLPEVPVRVLPGETLMIFLFAFLSSVAAAFFASRRVSEIHPARVLRYE